VPMALQHSIVLVVVGICLAWIVWQALGSLFGRKSKAGNCCTRGCEAVKPAQASERVHFLPADALRNR